MNRFFKSAAFPILLVVVLAFFFTKLASTGTSNGRSHSYQTLVSEELPKGEVKSVEFKNKGKVLEGKLKNKETMVEGIEHAVEAFVGLFEGKNSGKMVVKLA